MDHAAATRLAYLRLIDPAFRRHLRAVDPEGNHPIIVALRDDSIGSLVDQLLVRGGVSNVVVPSLNGVVIITTEVQNQDSP